MLKQLINSRLSSFKKPKLKQITMYNGHLVVDYYRYGILFCTGMFINKTHTSSELNTFVGNLIGCNGCKLI